MKPNKYLDISLSFNYTDFKLKGSKLKFRVKLLHEPRFSPVVLVYVSPRESIQQGYTDTKKRQHILNYDNKWITSTASTT